MYTGEQKGMRKEGPDSTEEENPKKVKWEHCPYKEVLVPHCWWVKDEA